MTNYDDYQMELELERLRAKSREDEIIKKRLKQEVNDLKIELKQMRSNHLVMNEVIVNEEDEIFWESRKDFDC